MSMRSFLLCCWKRVLAMTSVFSWQNCISLCTAKFCIPSQICLLLQVFLDFLLFHSSSLWWKGHLLWVLVLEVLVSLHRTIQLQLLQHYWLGHRLLWYWIVCLGNEQRLFCHFWDCIQVLHFGFFCWLLWYSIPSKKWHQPDWCHLKNG